MIMVKNRGKETKERKWQGGSREHSTVAESLGELPSPPFPPL